MSDTEGLVNSGDDNANDSSVISARLVIKYVDTLSAYARKLERFRTTLALITTANLGLSLFAITWWQLLTTYDFTSDDYRFATATTGTFIAFDLMLVSVQLMSFDSLRQRSDSLSSVLADLRISSIDMTSQESVEAWRSDMGSDEARMSRRERHDDLRSGRSNDGDILFEIRLTLRDHAAARQLPLVRSSSGPAIYFAINLALGFAVVGLSFT